MDTSNKLFKDVLILGGGPSGLAAGKVLTVARRNLLIFEGHSSVGGLSRTIEHHGFRFDLGGHRFLTENKKLEQLVRDTLKGEILTVSRSSKILLDNKYYDYPINIGNVLSCLGLHTSVKAIKDYLYEQIKSRFLRRTKPVSLEDWVVRQFGRTLFNIFFRQYSEKVWGINCNRIASEWSAQRIQGLSLIKAIKNALIPTQDKSMRTLTRSFLYPPLGFGQISENLKTEIEADIDIGNKVKTSSRIIAIHHQERHIESIMVQRGDDTCVYDANEFISSIPVTAIINMLEPPPPDEICQAASKLKFRDLIIVTVMINRERITDQTWIYIPDPNIPFGRIHEPKNWSTQMAPPGMTHLVTEYFCFKDDTIWNKTDEELTELTVSHLQQLGLIKRDDVCDSVVLRIQKAYPIFEVGYLKHFEQVCNYLEGFDNLHLIGRAGLFKYYNTDHAMESGIAAAESIIARNRAPIEQDTIDDYQEKFLFAKGDRQ
jgi:protoporphyrinogen oxidase